MANEKEAANTVIEGEVVESTERAMSIVNQGNDLDASLAVALSEAEINTQIATARRFPRSVQKAVDSIRQLATLDTATAAECNYSLPRGRDKETGKANAITGPSIRFAELVAQQWGNCRVAARVIATDRREKFVEAEGIYHDLETNSAVCARVRRRISDSRGKLYSDDMINVTANAASSIALRNAILRGVPRPVWRKAYEAVLSVIKGDVATIGARRVELIGKFKDELNIKPAQLFAALGVKGAEDIGLDEIVVAAGFFAALRNNEITIDDLLRQAGPASGGRTLAGAFGDQPKTTETVDPKTGEVTDPAKDADALRLKLEAAGMAAFNSGATDEPPAVLSPEEVDHWRNGFAAAAEMEEKKAATRDEVERGNLAGLKDGEKTVAEDLTEGKPAPEPEFKPGPITQGPAPAGVKYLLAGEGFDHNNRRPTYQDGERFSAVGAKGASTMPTYTEHAPKLDKDGAAEPKPDAPAEESGDGAAIHDNPEDRRHPDDPPADEDGGPDAAAAPFVEMFQKKADAADSWLTIKAAFGALRRTPEFLAASAGLQKAAGRYAYNSGQALVDAQKDPVSPANDPAFFGLFLEVGEVDAIRDAWTALVRTAAYRGLTEPQKDALANAYSAAVGDV